MSSKNIFIDIDGTLVNYKNEISDSTLYALKKSRENGHKIILCTGRTRFKIPPIITDVGFDGLIAGNGCYIEIDGNVILDQTLSLKDCSDIVDWLFERKIGFYHDCKDSIYANEIFKENYRNVMKEYSNCKTEEELDEYLNRGYC